MKIRAALLALILCTAPAFAVEAPTGYEEDAAPVPSEAAPRTAQPVLDEPAPELPVETPSARASSPPPPAPVPGSALVSFESDRPQDRRFPSGVLVSMERFVPPAPIVVPLRQFEVEEEALV